MSPFRFIKWVDEGNEVVLYGDGSQQRDFTYVDDIAEGTIKALKPLGFEVINLGNNQPHPLSRLISLIEKGLNKKARLVCQPAQKADMEATWADIGKAETVLDWRPRTSLEDGVTRTIAWHTGNRPLVSQVAIDLSV
jgi:UDP-glucuronate 4-epimerase